MYDGWIMCLQWGIGTSLFKAGAVEGLRDSEKSSGPIKVIEILFHQHSILVPYSFDDFYQGLITVLQQPNDYPMNQPLSFHKVVEAEAAQ